MDTLFCAGKDLEDFSYEDRWMADIILSNLWNVSFTGVKGLVYFDENGDSPTAINMYQMQGGWRLSVDLSVCTYHYVYVYVCMYVCMYVWLRYRLLAYIHSSTDGSFEKIGIFLPSENDILWYTGIKWKSKCLKTIRCRGVGACGPLHDEDSCSTYSVLPHLSPLPMCKGMPMTYSTPGLHEYLCRRKPATKILCPTL